MKKAIFLSAVAGATLFLLAGAGVAAATAPARNGRADSSTIATQAPAQKFAGDSAETPWEVATPRVPGVGLTHAAPPAPNRFVLMPLALLGIAAIGAGAAFTGFSLVNHI